jgi:cysteine sulfinate desulfinase/cysteine desulfurase-like protein
VRADITVNGYEDEEWRMKNERMKELKNGRIGEWKNGGVPHILNVSIPGIDNEFLVMRLDTAGIACSTKSSCLRDEDESYVLQAIGGDSKTAMRFSFGRWTKAGDVRKALNIIGLALL